MPKPASEPNEALRQARKAAGLTQDEAARRAGYSSKAGWAMVELGQATPPPERMAAIANVVKKPVRTLFQSVCILDSAGQAEQAQDPAPQQ